MHVIKNKFISKSEFYREIRQSTNIGHLQNGIYYDHDCMCSIINPSQKPVVYVNRAYGPSIWTKRSVKIEQMENMKKKLQMKMMEYWKIKIMSAQMK